MNHPPKDLTRWIEEKFFNAVPIYIGVIDKDFNLVYANPAFEKRFGNWRNQKCYAVYKSRDFKCEECKGAAAFQDGLPRVGEESGYDGSGKFIHYIKYTVPVAEEGDNVKYLLEISIDITEFRDMRSEYQLLFEQVPCNVLIIDRNFCVVRANKRAKKMIGSLEGKNCYEALKGLKNRCSECTARQTFEDGRLHKGYHVWTSKTGKIIHMHVITVPLMLEDNTFNTVMEMAVDVTQTFKLQDSLKMAHNYLEELVNNAMDGIVGINNKGKVAIFNSAARALFKLDADQIVSRDDLSSMLPSGFLAEVSEGEGHVYLPETRLKKNDGQLFPARLVGSELKDSNGSIGMAFSIQDLTQVKKLEKEKMEAERNAIVGQTVAGLAHGIKNLIYALEGGMYFLNSGLQKGDIERVHKGMKTLARNIDRTSMFAKSFLNFSRQRAVKPKLCDPCEIASEVIESLFAKARRHNIKLILNAEKKMEPISIDTEKMHECLTNLIGNAIDACIADEEAKEKFVKLSIFENNRIIHYEVKDNGCGMDHKTKENVFKKFFTTKGLEGTGLGLLMTKKIIEEHNGSIDVISKPGKGATFRIRLPRRRLPKII